MRFWDSSALVPLVVEEDSSELISGVIESDRKIVVWWGTLVECHSAIRRQQREGSVSPEGAVRSRARLDRLAGHWSEISPTEAIRAEADRAVAVHELAAADAFRLAAAIVWRASPERRRDFISLDRQLAERAQREGFDCPLQA